MSFSRKQWSLISILTVLILAFVAFFYIRQLRFDYDFEAFFPNEDQELNVYNDFRDRFEHDNEFVLLGLESKQGIFNENFLKQVDSLTRSLQKVENVRQVVSPTNLKEIIFGPLGPVETPLLHFKDASLFADDSLKIYKTGHLVGSFFPSNAKSVSIFIKTEDKLSKVKSDSLARRIERSVQTLSFEKVHYAGRIFAQDVYLKTLNREFVLFLTLSFSVIIIFLYFSFRSFYGVVVPVSIVLLSIYFTLGIMGLMNKPIDIMTVMLPTMIFIAGMSDVVHYFSKYFEELNKGMPKDQIHRLILKEVGFPTFLTLITTVVGFLSLLFSSIQPIRDFGIFTSVGIIIAFILSYTLLPALLYFFSPKKMIVMHDQNNKTYSRMRNLLFWIFRNQKGILIVSVLITALSIYGITQIRVNNILLEDLSESNQIKQDFNFFEREYSGVRPLEIKIAVNGNKNALDYDVLNEINKFDEYLRNHYEAGFLFSPAVLAKNLNRAFYQGDPAAYKFPDKDDYESDLKKYISENKKNKSIRTILSSDAKTVRITGKIRDMGSLKVKALNAKLDSFYNASINKDLISYQVTGAATLMDSNNEYMVDNMVQGFVWSFVVIGILTFILHRSWRMTLIFIIPNFIPMLAIAGLMGFAGIELKAATSLVFSIAFGVATDDTIHFISRFKIELGYGKSVLYAFKRTYFETGKPIILTTFILVGGFMSLMTSDFTSTFLFGFLICITIVIALIAELFLLPVLLLLLIGKDKSKTPSHAADSTNA